MLGTVACQMPVKRLLIADLLNPGETSSSQPVRQRLEVVGPTVLVPLMKDVVDDIHPRGQIGGKGIGHIQFTEAAQVRAAIGFQMALRIRYDDAQHSAGLERAPAISEKCRQFLARFQVLDKLLYANARRAAIAQRQTPPAVPPNHLWAAWDQVYVHETWRNMGPARHIYQQFAALADLPQAPPPPRQDGVPDFQQQGIQLDTKLVEQKSSDRHVVEEQLAETLFQGH